MKKARHAERFDLSYTRVGQASHGGHEAVSCDDADDCSHDKFKTLGS